MDGPQREVTMARDTVFFVRRRGKIFEFYEGATVLFWRVSPYRFRNFKVCTEKPKTSLGINKKPKNSLEINKKT